MSQFMARPSTLIATAQDIVRCLGGGLHSNSSEDEFLREQKSSRKTGR